jgi:hypothetical protein
MKVEKEPESFYILATYWNLSEKSGNLEILYPNLANLGPFFPWKLLCIGQNHIFQVEV